MNTNKVLNAVRDDISRHFRSINEYQRVADWVKRHEDQLVRLDISDFCAWAGSLTLFVQSHEAAIAVMLALPGDYDRWAQSDGTITYSTVYDGLSLKVSGSPPPPNCRIEIVEEVVPERIVRHHKVICKDD